MPTSFLPGDRPAGADRQVIEEGGVGRMVGRAPRGADLQETVRFDRPRIEDQAGDLHPVHVGHRDDRQALRRNQRGDAETEDDGIGLGDPQRVVQRVDAGGEQDVLARGQRGVEAGGIGRRGLRDVEPIDGNRLAGRRAVEPADALGVGLQAGTKTRYSPEPST